MDPQLIDMLRCPQTGKQIRLASSDEVESVNRSIEAGTCRDNSGELVTDTIQDGLVSDCGTWLYPVRDSIPSMIAEESIKLSNLTTLK